MVIQQAFYFGLLVAKGARRIFSYNKSFEFCFERIVNQELTDEWLPFSQNQLNGLCSLNQSNLPGYNSQDACLVSAGD